MAVIAENLSRQLDELTAMQTMYEVIVDTCDEDFEAIRVAASTNTDDTKAKLQYRIHVPLEPDCYSIELRVYLPHEYPSSQPLAATCSFGSSIASSKLEKSINANLAQRCAQTEIGMEAVMDIVLWLTEEGSARAAEMATAAQSERQIKPPVECSELHRVFYWIDHMLEGRQHKKEAKVVEVAKAFRLTGMLFYGRPSILIAEGSQADNDEFVSEARKAGKTLKAKQKQVLTNGRSDARYSKFTTVPGESSLDVEAFKGELAQLGLGQMYRILLGLEEA